MIDGDNVGVMVTLLDANTSNIHDPLRPISLRWPEEEIVFTSTRKGKRRGVAKSSPAESKGTKKSASSVEKATSRNTPSISSGVAKSSAAERKSKKKSATSAKKSISTKTPSIKSKRKKDHSVPAGQPTLRDIDGVSPVRRKRSASLSHLPVSSVKSLKKKKRGRAKSKVPKLKNCGIDSSAQHPQHPLQHQSHSSIPLTVLFSHTENTNGASVHDDDVYSDLESPIAHDSGREDCASKSTSRSRGRSMGRPPRCITVAVDTVPEGESEVMSTSVKVKKNCPTKNPSYIDEIQARESLKISMHQVATDAARIGKLTKLVEDAVEAEGLVDENEVVSTKDHYNKKADWKLKTTRAMEADLSRSNHFVIINEAAAVGQQRKLKSEDITSIQEEKAEEVPEIEVNCGAYSYIRRRRRLLLSASSLLDRYVQDSNNEKRKTMFAPENVLERQQHFDRIRERFSNGDIDWLPTSKVPTFKSPRVFLSQKRLRVSVAKEAANAADARNHRLSCIFRLIVKDSCTCVYCKNPNPFQTQAYQSARERNLSITGDTQVRECNLQLATSTDTRRCHGSKVAMPISGHSETSKVTPSLIASKVEGGWDVDRLYSRSQLRKVSKASPDKSTSTLETSSSKSAPVWAAPVLKRTAVCPRQTEDAQLHEYTPIWAMATGKRDDDLPDWASPALREILGCDVPVQTVLSSSSSSSSSSSGEGGIDQDDEFGIENVSIDEAGRYFTKQEEFIRKGPPSSPSSVIVDCDIERTGPIRESY